MRMSYDPRFNIAYIRFHESRDDVETIQISDELSIDLSADGMVYGIEFMNANEQLKRDENGKVLIINEATGESNELPLDIE
ncbi:MAG: DUF2283 domain-containing protein [Candidatus Latescibacteria bacterium]|jgi:uncharacterized protein YuzE|nr:DUF2283 domain-containing protein [Candidatus Latescibacterota bacterium]